MRPERANNTPTPFWACEAITLAPSWLRGSDCGGLMSRPGAPWLRHTNSYTEVLLLWTESPPHREAGAGGRDTLMALACPSHLRPPFGSRHVRRERELGNGLLARGRGNLRKGNRVVP